MLRLVVAGTLALLAVAEPLLAQRAQSALERVRASGRLRVGIDATYPPFGIAEGGEFSGFDVDIARAIARELRVDAELVNASFDGVFPALQNGSFDAVISAVTITPERSATLLFSDPYIAAGQQIVVRGDSTIAGPDDLAGRIVGVQINTTAQFAMEKRPGVTLAKYNTIDLALLDLQNGRVDAVASDGPVLRYMVRRSFPGLKTVGAEYTDEQFGVVLARGSDDLRRAVNAALWRLQDSGEYAKIYSKWFGAGAERGIAAAAPRAFDTAIIARTWSFFLRGVWMTAVMAASSLGLGLPLGLCPGAGARAVEAARLDAGRHLRRGDARHAAPRADPVRLLRAAERRRQPARVRERRPGADAERVRLHLRSDPRRHPVDRCGPDGGGARARHELLAGDAAHHPAADVPACRAAADQRRASRCSRIRRSCPSSA